MKLKLLPREDWTTKSHPARGAWVEINGFPRCVLIPWVAPRKGCVG